MPQNQKTAFWILCLTWFAINAVQAFTLGLHGDEAYYWFYSRILSWGYFDHPPMVALWIKIGYTLFQNELGMRLMTAVCSVLTPLVLWKTLSPEHRKPLVFFGVFTSVVLFHVYGFITTPDAPLLLFSAIFLYLYKKYLQKDSYTTALALAFCMALMMYSKYHGILVIGFAFLANLKLLKRSSFWFAAVLSILLFLPHLYWQYANDFPSFTYHLSGRSRGAYKFEFTLNYLYSQPLVAGPLTSIFLAFLVFRHRKANDFARALRFMFTGVLLFFLLTSFKGRVEAHWTAIAFLPLVLLGVPLLNANPKWKKTFFYLALPQLVLLLAARVLVNLPVLGQSNPTMRDFHGNQQWADAIAQQAGDHPVMFMNNYQEASRYWFYSGNPAHSYNTYHYRKNQFDLWQVDTLLYGKDVMYFSKGPHPGSDTLETYKRIYYPALLRNYKSLQHVALELETSRDFFAHPGQGMKMALKMQNNYPHNVNFAELENGPPDIVAMIYSKGSLFKKITLGKVKKAILHEGESYTQNVFLKVPEVPGKYEVMFTLDPNNELFLPLNSPFYKLEVD